MLELGKAMEATSRVPLAARRAPVRLSVATYNVKNLLDVERPSMLRNRPTPPKSAAERVALSRTIHQLDADVIALQEVGSEETLRHFRDTHLADLGYEHLVVLPGNDRWSHVALLSRFPLTSILSHHDVAFPVEGRPRPGHFTHDLLQATVQAGDGASFTLFVTQLRSQIGGPRSEPKRVGEARAISDVLARFERQNPGAAYALAGDLNDGLNSRTLRTLEDGPAHLTDAAALQGFTSPTYRAKRAQYDHIELSDALRAKLAPGGVEILDTPDARKASDHLPVKVTFLTRLLQVLPGGGALRPQDVAAS